METIENPPEARLIKAEAVRKLREVIECGGSVSVRET
jgi:hypothetical protein